MGLLDIFTTQVSEEPSKKTEIKTTQDNKSPLIKRDSSFIKLTNDIEDYIKEISTLD